ncbi:hypothetical protein Acr_17g0003210 [Actinidia rufa]|uniref:Ankyrin repeat family protein n=1 Tax=Actinidia rufa TaxID=165716 RepID=A0A7J0G1W4_9ERIC|nr:hypothetical protein Acr_17g0003210 [Actinidia rufa]
MASNPAAMQTASRSNTKPATNDSTDPKKMLSNYALKGRWPEDDAAKKKAVNVQNERENTPLHLAAAMGNVRMCKIIADMDNGLIGVRNKENETPFFSWRRSMVTKMRSFVFTILLSQVVYENDKTEKGYGLL